MIRHLNETYKFKEAILILFRDVEYNIHGFLDREVKKLLINMDIVKGEIRLSKTNKKPDIEVRFVSLGN